MKPLALVASTRTGSERRSRLESLTLFHVNPQRTLSVEHAPEPLTKIMPTPKGALNEGHATVPLTF